MSHTEIRFKPLITRLQQHFREHQYSFGVTWNYPVAARRFLRNLERQGLKIETVSLADVERYLDALRMKRRRGPLPEHSCRMHRASIHMLLRLVQGEWPPVAVPVTAHGQATQAMVMKFDTWMTVLRGLSPNTRRHLRAAMCSLLEWLHEQNKEMAKITIGVSFAYRDTWRLYCAIWQRDSTKPSAHSRWTT